MTETELVVGGCGIALNSSESTHYKFVYSGLNACDRIPHKCKVSNLRTTVTPRANTLQADGPQFEPASAHQFQSLQQCAAAHEEQWRCGVYQPELSLKLW